MNTYSAPASASRHHLNNRLQTCYGPGMTDVLNILQILSKRFIENVDEIEIGYIEMSIVFCFFFLFVWRTRIN